MTLRVVVSMLSSGWAPGAELAGGGPGGGRGFLGSGAGSRRAVRPKNAVARAHGEPWGARALENGGHVGLDVAGEAAGFGLEYVVGVRAGANIDGIAGVSIE